MIDIDKILQDHKDKLEAIKPIIRSDETDPLMDVYSLGAEKKKTNPQTYGSELGRVWQDLLRGVMSLNPAYKGRLVVDGSHGNRLEICDLRVGKLGLEAKYCVRSGDDSTIKKFKTNGPRLIELGYKPIYLVLRCESFEKSLKSIRKGGWQILTGDQAFVFIESLSGVDLKAELIKRKGMFAPKLRLVV